MNIRKSLNAIALSIGVIFGISSCQNLPQQSTAKKEIENLLKQQYGEYVVIVSFEEYQMNDYFSHLLPEYNKMIDNIMGIAYEEESIYNKLSSAYITLKTLGEYNDSWYGKGSFDTEVNEAKNTIAKYKPIYDEMVKEIENFENENKSGTAYIVSYKEHKLSEKIYYAILANNGKGWYGSFDNFSFDDMMEDINYPAGMLLSF